MESRRVRTIIQEIEYWKEHKLLPQHYCDFLLALYTKGEQINVNQTEKQSNVSSKFKHLIKIILLILLLPFSFLVIHFTEFHIYLQLAILTLFLCIALTGFLHIKRRRDVYSHFVLAVSLLLVLQTSIHVGRLFFVESTVLNIIIVLNFTFWIVISRIYKIQYLLLTGTIGIIFVIVYIKL